MRVTFSKSGLSKLLVMLIVVVIVLGSIGVGYFALTQLTAPTASPTPTPSPSPSPTPSPTAAPTQTPTPTSTPTPTPSPTAAPTSTPSPTFGWSKTFAGLGMDSGWSVVQTADGGYAIAGYTQPFNLSGVPATSEAYDVFLVKTDASGNLLWNKTYSGPVSYQKGWLVQTNDQGYAIACRTSYFDSGNGDIYLIKTDSAGNMLWNKTYGGPETDYLGSLVQSSDGGYVLVGTMTLSGDGDTDVFLAKVDSAGNMLWNRTYGGPDFDAGASLVQTGDGGYALAGTTWSFGAGQADVYLVKVDSAGNMLWNTTFGGSNWDRGQLIIQTGDGGYAIGCNTRSFSVGEDDFYLVKTDSAGNMLWNSTFGGPDDDYCYHLVQANDGGYVLVGYTRSFGAGNSDVFMVKFDSAGNMLWNKTYGRADGDYGIAVIRTGDGGYAIVGGTDSDSTEEYDYDVYLVKTDSAGIV